MDPSEPGERCLPEMGLSGWMKRTMERSYDLSDFCNSPPVDGFYYPTNLQQQQAGNTKGGVAGKGNCSADPNKKEELRNCTVMGGVMSINEPHQPLSKTLSHALGTNPAMYQTAGINTIGGGGCPSITAGNEKSSIPDYLKPVVSGLSASQFSKQLSLGLNNQPFSVSDSPTKSDDGRDPQSSPEEMRTWASEGDLYHGDMNKSHPTDDSAPTPVDHIVSNRFTPTIQISTQEEEGGSLRLVEKLGAVGSCPATPDVTPNTTPAVTPSCSPKVSRRAGNPFFTGSDDSNSNSSGSWLFRPGKKTGGDTNTLQPDKLYEAKIEYQPQPNSKVTKKTVRYVPRPSELRELNFWSPTSM